MPLDLNKICESNEEWVAQQIVLGYKEAEMKWLQATLRKLNKVCYKSWAHRMTLEEIMQAVDMAVEHGPANVAEAG